MNSDQTSRNVIVIGGGIAGMSAARILNDHQIHAHIVEKQEKFGGHAARWSCMATDNCQSCSACLSGEAAWQMENQPYITPYLNSRITNLEYKDAVFEATIEGEKTHHVKARDIILATGFLPAEPGGLLGQSWQENDNVITTAELNQALQANLMEERLAKLPHPPKIAFFQCVGSRNRETGKDYCSQVCCKISMRHINKLLHLNPEADITLFYIDLQVIGKEMRTFCDSVSDRIRLIQGVPLEVFDDRENIQVCVICEDPDNGSRIKSGFDLLVLSVGLHENPSIQPLMEQLGVKSDLYGFLSDSKALAKRHIRVAGTAEGPMDIQKAKHRGIAVAQDIIRQGRQLVNDIKPVSVIGETAAADDLSKKLLENGFSVTRFSSRDGQNSDTISWHDRESIRTIKGTAGSYRILCQTGNQVREVDTLAIVVADAVQWRQAGDALGIPEGSLLPLSKFLAMRDKESKKLPESITFWLDYSGPENKVAARQVVLEAQQLARAGRKITVIMNKMLVHGLQGQKIYDKARGEGIRFLRVDAPDDVRVRMSDGQIAFSLKEKGLKKAELSFLSDLLVIPEYPHPPEDFLKLADALKQPLDREGYYQSNNVRHQLVKSPRKGLYYLGECHTEVDASDITDEIDLIVKDIMDIADDVSSGGQFDIEINSVKCKKCLTCYRVCPHGAIVLEGNTPWIAPGNCYGCGLCISSCPALAIESQLVSDSRVLQSVQTDQWTVFACERSGKLAADRLPEDLNINVQTVPCVCRISRNIIIKALEKKNKVILAGCHDENCRSEKGSGKAAARIQSITRLPGVNPDHVHWFPVAANESRRLEQFIKQTIGGNHADM